jgi:hypothetical protein
MVGHGKIFCLMFLLLMKYEIRSSVEKKNERGCRKSKETECYKEVRYKCQSLGNSEWMI